MQEDQEHFLVLHILIQPRSCIGKRMCSLSDLYTEPDVLFCHRFNNLMGLL
jgi:hypothetical protein